MDLRNNLKRISGIHVNTDTETEIQNKIFNLYVDLCESCELEEGMDPEEAKSSATLTLLRMAAEAIPPSGRTAARKRWPNPFAVVNSVFHL